MKQVDGIKVCSRCRESLPVTEFNKCSKESDGLNCTCRSCVNARRKEYLKRPSNRVRRYVKTEPIMHGTKTCSSCRKELPVLYFTVHRTAKDGLYSSCRECNRASKAKKSNRLSREHTLILRGDV